MRRRSVSSCSPALSGPDRLKARNHHTCMAIARAIPMTSGMTRCRIDGRFSCATRGGFGHGTAVLLTVSGCPSSITTTLLPTVFVPNRSCCGVRDAKGSCRQKSARSLRPTVTVCGGSAKEKPASGPATIVAAGWTPVSLARTSSWLGRLTTVAGCWEHHCRQVSEVGRECSPSDRTAHAPTESPAVWRVKAARTSAALARSGALSENDACPCPVT